MSFGDYQSFNLDLTDTGCVDEVIEAIVQRRVEALEETIRDLEERLKEVTTDAENYEVRIRELEDEIVTQRSEMYEK